MQTEHKLVAQLPHPGFYHSTQDDGIDQEEERFLDNLVEIEVPSEDHAGFPEAARLTRDQHWSILDRYADWQKAYLFAAQKYVETVVHLLKQEHQFEALMEFESVSSPKQYNFSTDRVFVHVAIETMEAIKVAIPKADFIAAVEEQFTSRDGFSSFYGHHARDPEGLWNMPFGEMDHNELMIFLDVFIAIKLGDSDDEDAQWKIYYAMSEDGDFAAAFDAAIDWPKYNAAVLEKRNEQLAEEGLPPLPVVDEQTLPLPGV